MLAHSPPLPLIVDYSDGNNDMTEDDEEGAILALKQRDRVHRVRLRTPVTSLQKLIAVMDEEYPILKYLIIEPPYEDRSTILIPPETLQAPNLRLLSLAGFALPIGSRLLTTAVGLATLCLFNDVFMDDPSTHVNPNVLLRWLSFMPQLEALVVSFFLPIRRFRFRGVNAYLEALAHRTTTPRLEKLKIEFFHQFTFSVPRLLQFMSTPENLEFESANFWFYDERVYVEVYPRGKSGTYALSINVDCWHLNWQVTSVAQIFNSLSQIFSAVEHLTLQRKVSNQSSEEHNEVDHTEWRKLLGSFRNVKTLYIGNGLTEQLSLWLDLEDREPLLGLLPELQELTYSGSGNTGGAFTS